jgi:uncharacterized protein DUF6687
VSRRFVFYREGLDPDGLLVVDGVAASAFNLSHWPGNRTPERYRADTTTEMALRLATDPDREELLSRVRLVSNNHFDTDGLLSAWVVLNPDQALPHRRFLIDAARAGDFQTFTSADAVKFDLMVTAFSDPRRSPIAEALLSPEEADRAQALYDELLGRLPELFYQSSAHRPLWEDEFEGIVRSFARLRDGGAVIREHPASRLSVLETEEDLAPMARFDSCRFHRILTATREGDAVRYQLEHHIFSWFDTVTPPRGARLDLTPLCLPLNRIETAPAARWTYTGNHDLAARLYLADERGEPVASRLRIGRVESIVAEALHGR